ncbi:MAG: 50S ribosomal protein L25/general stress protein Ctc [Hyphomicrobiaceae bacterium]
MSTAQVIKAVGRPAHGKGATRAVRREGNVPAIIYGGGVDSQDSVAINANELMKVINRGRFLATVFNVEVDGKVIKAIPRDVQLDPVRDTPLHVDFQRIGADNQVRLRVPVRFTNELLSPGLKRGGVLNVVRREVEVWAPADRVPEFFAINLEGMDIGRSIHISFIQLPDGVTPVIQDRDFTIATIAGTSAKGDSDSDTDAGEGEEAAETAAAAPAAEKPKK